MPNENDLRVWWIPQVPMKAFYVSVKTPAEGRKILDTLADYDIFQYENNVKPDFTNAGGLEILDGDEWVDWAHPDCYCDIDECTVEQLSAITAN